ncbi:ribosomal protein S6 kinase delta-1 [Cataglyphis hispanica]|uniref:ribosomal protein S6 kinase delta-1 n=1 Tax=Cataglyphis hispanica TaxID=1086592 RepID=UPI0021807995|nr:ribosomal protein S6 kinase delta-1 [Cataglyphis hispanica]
MAPAKDKWIKRFIITETRRHKKGFTIYKITSMVFLKSSREELSKVSVWKRYNDFKKLHSELSSLHKCLGIKEAFPTFPKSKYFGRFETEVVEERKRYILNFLEFVGRHSYLYSSDIFITFFETSHADNYANYCAHSLCSDTSEDDLITPLNDSANDIAAQNLQVLSKTSRNVLTNPCSALPNIIYTNENEFVSSERKNESLSTTNLQIVNVKKEEQSYKTEKSHAQNIRRDCDADIKNKNFDKDNVTTLSNVSGFYNVNNNIKDFSNCNTRSTCSILQEKANTSYQTQTDFTQYLLIAAAHMSAAFKHESIAEYEEAFMQYKLGISCLINGVQFDPDSTRVPSIKDKISKYLARAEQLYNRHLNCNISIVSKPISELQYYKVLKVIKSVMLVMDIRANCKRIIKTVERSSIHEDNISDYILRGQIPYMVHLCACIETETTVFLILQYASCGKLWDFVSLHYEASDYLYTNVISNHVCTNKHINQDLDNNENIHEPNKTEEIVENNKWRRDHQCSVDVLNEIYTEVPTIQLLEKSQKLLQSVNATLKKSNSIANQLNESKGLRHSKDTLSINEKARVFQESDCTLSDIYCNKSSNNIKIDNISEDSKDANSLSISNSENSNISKNIRVSALNENCTNHNLLANKTDELFHNNSKTVSIQNVLTDNVIYICKNNNIKDSIDRTISSNVNSSIDEIQYSHSCKENTMDEEKILWQIPEAVIRSWAAEILLALEALHQQNVLILDFKPDNILLDDAGHVRLTYIVPQRNVELSKLTYPYSSPECTMYSPTILVTSATDIWSFGVILYELLTGIMFIVKHPGLFHSHSTVNIPGKLSENARSLLYGILKYHPNERLTIDEIKRHLFFAGIDWSNMDNFQT